MNFKLIYRYDFIHLYLYKTVNSSIKFSCMYVSCFDCVYSLLFPKFLDYQSNSKNWKRTENLSKNCSQTSFWDYQGRVLKKISLKRKNSVETIQEFSVIVELNTQQPVCVQPLPKICKKNNTKGWDEKHLEQSENNAADLSSVIKVRTSKTH